MPLSQSFRKAIFTCFFPFISRFVQIYLSYHRIQQLEKKKLPLFFQLSVQILNIYLSLDRNTYIKIRQYVNQPSFSQIHRTLLQTPPAPRFPTRNSTLQPSPRQGRRLLTPLKNRTHNVIVIIMFIMLIMFILFIIVLLLSLLKHKCKTNICGIRC